jgi:hypothetical protein
MKNKPVGSNASLTGEWAAMVISNQLRLAQLSLDWLAQYDSMAYIRIAEIIKELSGLDDTDRPIFVELAEAIDEAVEREFAPKDNGDEGKEI